MENSLPMSVSDGACNLRHHAHTLARVLAELRRRSPKAAAGGVFHAEIRQPFFTFADLVNGKNVWVIEARDRFGFAPKAHQRLVRIHLMSENALYRDDAPRMLLACSINDPHSATPDLFQDFVVTEAPVRIGHIRF
jgi:hypothetical protein